MPVKNLLTPTLANSSSSLDWDVVYPAAKRVVWHLWLLVCCMSDKQLLIQNMQS